ncbi:MAG: hypothetical protein Q8O64_06565 [Sideroxyarcus sp.]|nr:hypothetical protein [Sideroxyarcus sp.]
MPIKGCGASTMTCPAPWIQWNTLQCAPYFTAAKIRGLPPAAAVLPDSTRLAQNFMLNSTHSITPRSIFFKTLDAAETGSRKQ